ncbi:MAG TPA: hypothetical protein PLR18_03420 [bacterium]|nr:hypothetical protein [bacterium]
MADYTARATTGGPGHGSSGKSGHPLSMLATLFGGYFSAQDEGAFWTAWQKLAPPYGQIINDWMATLNSYQRRVFRITVAAVYDKMGEAQAIANLTNFAQLDDTKRANLAQNFHLVAKEINWDKMKGKAIDLAGWSLQQISEILDKAIKGGKVATEAVWKQMAKIPPALEKASKEVKKSAKAAHAAAKKLDHDTAVKIKKNTDRLKEELEFL